MLMGDSNMRHTYYWWTSEVMTGARTTSSNYGLDRQDLDYGGRWADQECLITTTEDDTNVTARFSFRFLHGSIDEFWYNVRNWGVAREASWASPSEKDFQNSTTTAKITGDDDAMWVGRIKPSDYALWVTKNQKPIQSSDGSNLESALRKTWTSKTSPDVVIITQGWGGVPTTNDLDVVKAMINDNPETLFVWSPLYVTDVAESRYNSYVDANVFNWTKPNLRMVNLWDMAQHLPSEKGVLHHIPVGGDYMKKAMERFWNEVEDCRKL